MLGRPVVSIGYHWKNDALMADMGLAAYCQHIEHFTMDRLIEQFRSLMSERDGATQRIQQKCVQYREMLDVLRFLAERVSGEAILAYLPGWEGRYYWQYGDYRPEPRLGGSAEFARLADGARALGIHLMPMFGANCANLRLPALGAMPADAHLASGAGDGRAGIRGDAAAAGAHADREELRVAGHDVDVVDGDA